MHVKLQGRYIVDLGNELWVCAWRNQKSSLSILETNIFSRYIYVFHWCLRAYWSHLTDFHARTHLPFYGMEPWLCLSNIIPNWHYKQGQRVHGSGIKVLAIPLLTCRKENKTRRKEPKSLLSPERAVFSSKLVFGDISPWITVTTLRFQ